MSSDSRLVFDRVWKKFHRGEQHDSLRDLIPALARRAVGRGPRRVELADGDFWAVRDLSFEVLPGDTLGIIGSNGSGKSTTLRMLTKILEPSRGRTEVRGRVGALIEVSAGFHGDLTGRENVYLQGAIMGMPAKHIARKFDEIVAFSGIPEFIDTPVKRYSSGMNARLGFSIAAHLEPDVLIIDEVLAVGDMAFQERAFGRIRDLAKSGIPVVIVSHQLDRVVELCTTAILLRRGEVVYRGTAADTVSAYVQGLEPAAADPAERDPSAPAAAVEFHSVRQIDDLPVRSGGVCAIEVHGAIHTHLRDSVEPLQVRVRSLISGRTIYMTGARMLGTPIESIGPFALRLDLQMNVAAGNYIVEVFAHDGLTHRDIAVARSVMIVVTDNNTFRGTHQMNAEFVPTLSPV